MAIVALFNPRPKRPYRGAPENASESNLVILRHNWARGLTPHLSVCGWLFCLDVVDGVDNMEGGVM